MNKYFIVRRLFCGDESLCDCLFSWNLTTEEYTFVHIGNELARFSNSIDKVIDNDLYYAGYDLSPQFRPFLFDSFDSASIAINIIKTHANSFETYNVPNSIPQGVDPISWFDTPVFNYRNTKDATIEIQYYVLESSVMKFELPSIVNCSTLVQKHKV